MTVSSSELEQLIAEAHKYPGGWVYALDGRYDPNGAIPLGPSRVHAR